jgi:hypothetical protein|tara:strand:+ start:176 stop:322 length:147 start_codon:yes stop_codon:yes gene_type:complete
VSLGIGLPGSVLVLLLLDFLALCRGKYLALKIVWEKKNLPKQQKKVIK